MFPVPIAYKVRLSYMAAALGVPLFKAKGVGHHTFPSFSLPDHSSSVLWKLPTTPYLIGNGSAPKPHATTSDWDTNALLWQMQWIQGTEVYNGVRVSVWVGTSQVIYTVTQKCFTSRVWICWCFDSGKHQGCNSAVWTAHAELFPTSSDSKYWTQITRLDVFFIPDTVTLQISKVGKRWTRWLWGYVLDCAHTCTLHLYVHQSWWLIFFWQFLNL